MKTAAGASLQPTSSAVGRTDAWRLCATRINGAAVSTGAARSAAARLVGSRAGWCQCPFADECRGLPKSVSSATHSADRAASPPTRHCADCRHGPPSPIRRTPGEARYHRGRAPSTTRTSPNVIANPPRGRPAAGAVSRPMPGDLHPWQPPWPHGRHVAPGPRQGRRGLGAVVATPEVRPESARPGPRAPGCGWA